LNTSFRLVTNSRFSALSTAYLQLTTAFEKRPSIAFCRAGRFH